MIYYTDGSTSEHGNYIAVTDKENNVLIFKKIEGEKKLTNNETEYMAIIECLGIIKSGSKILSDSKLCVEQINGNWAVKQKHLEPYVNKSIKLIKTNNITIEWIPREENLAGHHLELFIKSANRKKYRRKKELEKLN